MTLSNSDLVLEFFNVGACRSAANMHIAETDVGDRLLVGYNHAVYAIIAHDDRFEPVCFTGWKGASSSTNQHISMIEDKCEHHFDGRPSPSDVQGGKSLAYLSQISSNDKEYGGYHGRRDGRRV